MNSSTGLEVLGNGLTKLNKKKLTERVNLQ